MILSYFNKVYRVLFQDNRHLLILKGLKNTLIISIGGLLIGITLGTLIALAKIHPYKSFFGKLLKKIANIYTTIIRGTPVTAQLLLIYFGILASVRSLDALTVAIIVFGINSSAYVSEIIRGGILSIDKGQLEAARSLGLNYRQAMIKVILPQTAKIVLPSLVNEFIALLKETSVAGFITVIDLTAAFRAIVASTYDAFLPYFVMSLTYLILVIFITTLAKRLEKRLYIDKN